MSENILNIIKMMKDELSIKDIMKYLKVLDIDEKTVIEILNKDKEVI